MNLCVPWHTYHIPRDNGFRIMVNRRGARLLLGYAYGA